MRRFHINKARITTAVFLWALVPTCILLWLVTRLWSDAPGIAPPTQVVNERQGMGLVMTLGAIGGYVRWMHYLRTIVDDPEKVWQWAIDSALTPLMGACLALLFCLAFRAGLTVQVSPPGNSSVNWMGIYALAGMAGLFSPDAIKRLEVTFQALFANQSQEQKRKAAVTDAAPSPPPASNRQTDTPE